MSKFLTLSGFKKDQFIIELKVFVPETQIVGYGIKRITNLSSLMACKGKFSKWKKY